MKEICICAAIKLKNGLIIRGHRHVDCFRTAKRMGIGGLALINRIEGFITSTNRFVDRKEAREIQRSAGIPSKNKSGYFEDELYSEDLY